MRLSLRDSKQLPQLLFPRLPTGMIPNAGEHRASSGRASWKLPRFRRFNVGLEVNVVVHDNLPFTPAFCHHLQKARTKSALAVQLKIGRRANPSP